MKKVRTLVVDDSALYRSQIKVALRQQAHIELIGAAADGKEALRLLDSQPVDCVILDIEMPGMNGLEVLREFVKMRSRAKVIMFASKTKTSSEVTLEALQNGACDFILKPGNEDSSLGPSEKIANVLIPILESLFDIRVAKPIDPVVKTSFPRVLWENFLPKILVIGASTGGPAAIEELFTMLVPPFKIPVLITQHMPAVFTKSFAERLARTTGIPIKEAEHDDKIEAGSVYIAPGNFHMRIGKKKNDYVVLLDQGPPVNSVRPAVDPLFESAADFFKHDCLGVVLTGMGNDGAAGALAIKNTSGAIIIQDAGSCVVYGMPRAVADLKAFDFQKNLLGISELINEKISLEKEQKNASINS